jgi:hypothetical protein
MKVRDELVNEFSICGEDSTSHKAKFGTARNKAKYEVTQQNRIKLAGGPQFQGGDERAKGRDSQEKLPGHL